MTGRQQDSVSSSLDPASHTRSFSFLSFKSAVALAAGLTVDRDDVADKNIYFFGFEDVVDSEWNQKGAAGDVRMDKMAATAEVGIAGCRHRCNGSRKQIEVCIESKKVF